MGRAPASCATSARSGPPDCRFAAGAGVWARVAELTLASVCCRLGATTLLYFCLALLLPALDPVERPRSSRLSYLFACLRFVVSRPLLKENRGIVRMLRPMRHVARKSATMLYHEVCPVQLVAQA